MPPHYIYSLAYRPPCVFIFTAFPREIELSPFISFNISLHLHLIHLHHPSIHPSTTISISSFHSEGHFFRHYSPAPLCTMFQFQSLITKKYINRETCVREEIISTTATTLNRAFRISLFLIYVLLTMKEVKVATPPTHHLTTTNMSSSTFANMSDEFSSSLIYFVCIVFQQR